MTGLLGCTFIDKTREPPNSYQECRDVVSIGEWTDRIYTHTPSEHIITNVVSGRKMRIQKYNLPDTVIWNPWVEKAKEIADFGDDEYPNMICVESGHVSTPVTLMPGTAFEASQILQVRVMKKGDNSESWRLIYLVFISTRSCSYSSLPLAQRDPERDRQQQ